eukprot:4777524-Prymnesium_polylepis.1
MDESQRVWVREDVVKLRAARMPSEEHCGLLTHPSCDACVSAALTSVQCGLAHGSRGMRPIRTKKKNGL